MPRQTFADDLQLQHRSRPGRTSSTMGGQARRGGDGSRVAAKKKASKKARPTSSIIERNRKTEICRNWEKGACTFGDKCAFAHGHEDIKHKTLRDLEKEGRIPDASKHHAFPCMSWVATGGCPYGPGCVFIHDSRVKNLGEALLRAPCVGKFMSGTGSGTTGGHPRVFCLSGADNDNGGRFFFPDIPKDPDSIELPADEVQYHIRPGHEFSTAYKLWHSFVSMCIEWSSVFIGNSNHNGKTPTDPSNRGSRGVSGIDHTLLPPDTAVTPPAPAIAAFSYKDAATASASFPPTCSTSYKDAATAAGARATHGNTITTFAATSSSFAFFGADASPPTFDDAQAWPCPSRSVIQAGSRQLEVSRLPDSTRVPVKPLPVFEDLRAGTPAHLRAPPPDDVGPGSLHRAHPRVTASPGSPASEKRDARHLPSAPADRLTTPPREAPTARRTDDDDDHVLLLQVDRGDDRDNDSYLSCPSSSSESSAPSSLDSYLSCHRSPPSYLPWCPMAQSPPPGVDIAEPSSAGSSNDAFLTLLDGGCAGAGTLSTADAGSWSSGTSTLGEEHEHRDDGFAHHLHRFEPALLSPSRTADAVLGASARASSRLPVFMGLNSYDIEAIPPTASNGSGSSGGDVLLHGYGAGRCGGDDRLGPSEGFQDDAFDRRPSLFDAAAVDPLFCGDRPTDVNDIPFAQRKKTPDSYLPRVQQLCHSRELHQHQQQQPFAGFS